MANFREKLKRSPRYRKRFLVACVAVFVVVAALTTLLAVLLGNGERGQVEIMPPKASDSITFGDEEIPILEDVPKSQLDPALFKFVDGYLTYDSADVPTYFGIDVSTFQGWIDWEKVKAAGVEFAMIRVGYRGYTDGDIFADNRFYQNINGAIAAGIDVGIYFFSHAITVEEAIEEARWTIEMIKYYDIQYPVAYDFEFYGFDTRASGVSGEEITEFANAFCDTVAEAGYTPMVYFNRQLAYKYYNLSDVDQYDFWIADLNEIPTFYYEFTILQYSHTGKVDGVEEEVDLNLSFKDYAAAQ